MLWLDVDQQSWWLARISSQASLVFEPHYISQRIFDYKDADILFPLGSQKWPLDSRNGGEPFLAPLHYLARVPFLGVIS
jgi:hypothetical protein